MCEGVSDEKTYLYRMRGSDDPYPGTPICFLWRMLFFGHFASTGFSVLRRILR